MNSVIRIKWVDGRDIRLDNMGGIIDTLKGFLYKSKGVALDIGDPNRVESDDDMITKLSTLTKRLDTLRHSMDEYKALVDQANVCNVNNCNFLYCIGLSDGRAVVSLLL
mmetsp:Transcript_12078/g.10053  ORF Transcript_12078/g.10053 Transcript_12078/m.10053 type:complete len:109 (+) Transcript_12078:206-532(+)